MSKERDGGGNSNLRQCSTLHERIAADAFKRRGEGNLLQVAHAVERQIAKAGDALFDDHFCYGVVDAVSFKRRADEPVGS